MSPIDTLLAEARTIGSELLDLGRISQLLGWDQETMMPSAGAPYRARQRATLQGIAHERLTHQRVGEVLAALAEPAAAGVLAPLDAAIVRELRREYDLAVKLPNDFVRELAQATSEGVEIWRRARAESRFADFAPALEHIMLLKRQEVDYLGYTQHPYDALLDQYEPGLTVAQLTPLFADLRRATVALLDRLLAAPNQPERDILEREYDLSGQWAFGETILETIGFDRRAGRLDRSTHPFASGFGPGDVRLTTRLRANDLAEAIFGNLHEGGHGLYEQGLDPELAETIIGQYVSLGMHESQSRLWENFVGRSLSFWRFLYPRLQATFPDQLGAVPVDTFVRAINRVQPSLIRTEADEVTYNLHIILRYEIECRLLAGEVKVRDLPSLWNTLMHDYLGVTPDDDRSGVLQDTHWAIGAVGYFPTYTLGNLYAAQLWTTLRRDLPDLDDQISEGNLAGLLEWLRTHIHQPGRLHQPTELLIRATGTPLDATHLITYLNQKFDHLYGLV